MNRLYIDDLVALVANRNPELLADLRTRHPNHAAIFTAGMTLGEDDDDARPVLAVKEFLLESIPEAQGELAECGRRLAHHRTKRQRLTLVSQYLSAAVSSGILAAICTLSNLRVDGSILAGTAAASALVASVATIHSTNSTDINGYDVSFVAEQIFTASQSLEDVQRQFAAAERFGWDERLDEIARRANSAGAQVRAVHHLLTYSHPSRPWLGTWSPSRDSP